MKCMKFQTRNSRGFTLIEIIVSLIVAGILGAMLYQFMGQMVMKSAKPVVLSQNGAILNLIMENMNADYRCLISEAAINGSSPASAMTTFIGNVGAEGTNRTFYSTAAYTVVVNHKISFSGTPLTEVSDSGSKILKVTLKYQDLTASALYTE